MSESSDVRRRKFLGDGLDAATMKQNCRRTKPPRNTNSASLDAKTAAEAAGKLAARTRDVIREVLATDDR